MPNWCQNILTVSGPVEDVNGFVEAVKTDDSPLSLSTLYPLPDDVEKGEIIQGNNGIRIATMSNAEYNWHVKHWGTKWDVCEVTSHESIGDGVKTVTYRFESAWSPPVEWLEHVVMDNDDLMNGLSFTLAYCEAGVGYVGMASGDSSVGIYDDESGDLCDIEFAEAAESVGFEGWVAMYEEHEGNPVY
jgi:hypothetical protein